MAPCVVDGVGHNSNGCATSGALGIMWGSLWGKSLLYGFKLDFDVVVYLISCYLCVSLLFHFIHHTPVLLQLLFR